MPALAANDVADLYTRDVELLPERFVGNAAFGVALSDLGHLRCCELGVPDLFAASSTLGVKSTAVTVTSSARNGRSICQHAARLEADAFGVETPGASIATGLPVFSVSVGHVVGMGADEQMAGSDTERGVTVVQDLCLECLNVEAVCDGVGQSVRPLVVACDAQASVAIVHRGVGPEPTRAKFGPVLGYGAVLVDLVPEAIFPVHEASLS